MGREKKNSKSKVMSARTMILMTMGTAFLTFLIIVIALFALKMSETIDTAEAEHVDSLSNVIFGSIENAMDNLHSNTRTWSSWDEAYQYALGNNPDFAKANLGDGTMLTLYKMDFVLIKDASGKDLFTTSKSEADESQRLPFPEGLSEKITPIAMEVIEKQSLREGGYTDAGPYGETGFVECDGQTYMVCVMPIVVSDESDSRPSGAFTFFIRFGAEQLEQLTKRATAAFKIVDDGTSRAVGHEIDLKDINTTTFILTLKSVGGDRNVTIQFDQTRDFFTNVSQLAISTIMLTVTIFMLFCAGVFQILERLLLYPLGTLISDVENLSETESIDAGKYRKQQEFSLLSGAINDVLARLSESYAKQKESDVSLSVLTNILNGLDAYIYVSGLETDEILFVNEKMRKHFGITDDCVGKTCWKIFQDGFDSRCDFCPCIKLSDSPGETIVWEEQNTVTGRIYKNTDSVILWANDQMVHLQHSVDITDIKLAELSLQKRLNQQALTTKISQLFISDRSADDISDEVLKLTGEFLGLAQILFFKFNDDMTKIIRVNEWSDDNTPSISIPGEMDLPREVIEMIEKVSDNAGAYLEFAGAKEKTPATRVRVNYENFVITPVFVSGKLWGGLDFARKHGEAEWTESDLSMITLVSSLFTGFFSRHMILRQLRDIGAIVESSSSLIMYLTGEGFISYVNPSVQPLTGFTQEEVLSAGLYQLCDAETVDRWIREFIPETIQEGAGLFEISIKRKDGEIRVFSVSSFVMQGETGRIGAIASDVTAVRRLEAEIILARDLAEQGNRSKSEFLSRMSHEMRTPMNAIIGMTSIAQSTEDYSKKEYCLEKISNASHHLLGVINDVLDMSKIEANKFELSVGSFNVDKMFLNVANVVGFRIEEKSQDFSLFIEPRIPDMLIGDAQRIAQVAVNLLTNAVKFTPENGKIKLAATIEHEDHKSIVLKIVVSDNGIGISGEQKAKLFQSFEQGDGSIARRFGGTGLGLAISKKIVELMDGEIWVESELGVGSDFIFTMKLKKDARDESRNRRRELIKKADLNILVVDDNPEVCEYIKTVMELYSIPCTSAYSGAEALAVIDSAEREFNVIFVDWQMPEMDGVELIREIRKNRFGNQVIIMISASAWSDIESSADDIGIDDFITKPIFPSLLVDRLNRFVAIKDDARRPEETEIASVQTTDFSGKTVLLAEDVEINREIVITILEDTGITIDCAEDGRVAFDMFSANPKRYDMIFMDMHMPEVDGLESTRMIRALDEPYAKEIPIVAMTANVFREDIENCLAAGMNGHIGKPIDFDALLETLKKNLNR